MAKRGHGEGSIYKRSDGLWVGSISLGHDAEGKRVRHTFYGNTRKEVAAKITDLQAKQTQGIFITPTRTTVGQHFKDWLQQKKLHTRPGTWHRDESHINNHILPALGHLQLNKLSHRDIVDFYLYLQEETELAERTIYDIATILRAGLKDAVNKQLIYHSPADKIPKPKKGTKEARFMDQTEISRFLKALKGDRLENYFVLMLHTGLRPGEALGLAWEQVDLQNSRITVSQALHEVNGKLSLGETKTASSMRTISLSDAGVQALKAQRKRQLEEQLGAGSKWHNNYNLVFTTPTGNPLSRTAVLRNILHPILKKAEIDNVTLHTFRHTHASILIYQGADIKTIAGRLGHADITTTLQIYGHILPGQDERAAQLMDDFIKSL